ncbi:hypothetical protein ABZ397_21315 [Streptomyces sp. NPDC005876]|uniref:hypothetical protein n=1 Tax=Streptomyces sp. NPDC005876 TaxID=3157076 RepID=UPI0033EC40CE
MPTPYGPRGGLAFGAEELRVLRRALALALNPSPVPAEEDVQDCLRLAESLDEAARESARLRAFLAADLARYRAALPGTAAGYLTLLDEALCAGHRPHRDDLAALRALSGNPTAAALLSRCRAHTLPQTRTAVEAPAPAPRPAPTVPAARTRLLQALPGGRTADRHATAAAAPAVTTTMTTPAPMTASTTPQKPTPQPDEPPAREPAPRQPAPKRPVPTPGEVFPRRKPAAPPATPGQHLAAG